MPYYAVAKGRRVGIFNTWQKFRKQVFRFSCPIGKKFYTFQEAEEFLSEHCHNFSCSYKQIINYLRMIHSKILTNEEGDRIVYTDGACHHNGQLNACAGIGVFWANDHPDNVSRRLRGPQTNNRAEIEAAIVAIETALENDYQTLDIHTDSQFMIDAMNNWIHEWNENGWKLANGEPVKNKDDWIKLFNVQNKLDRVIWTKVKGHSRNYGNDQAHMLANRAII